MKTAAPEYPKGRGLLAGKTVLVTAHGNSLRALVKHLDGISDSEIVGLNIPTGIPLVYDLDESGREKWIDYDRVFGILRKANYNGFISMIYEGKVDKSTVIPRAIRFLRSFVAS